VAGTPKSPGTHASSPASKSTSTGSTDTPKKTKTLDPTPQSRLVERWFAELTNRKLRRSAHRSVTELETDIRKWINEWNKNPKPFVWTKTADEILETLAAYCRRVSSQER
jgi:hypothetical protein